MTEALSHADSQIGQIPRIPTENLLLGLAAVPKEGWNSVVYYGDGTEETIYHAEVDGTHFCVVRNRDDNWQVHYVEVTHTDGLVEYYQDYDDGGKHPTIEPFIKLFKLIERTWEGYNSP